MHNIIEFLPFRQLPPANKRGHIVQASLLRTIVAATFIRFYRLQPTIRTARARGPKRAL